MGYLQLAEGNAGHVKMTHAAHLAQNNPQELYIFVPDDDSGETGTYVREDFFDVYSDDQYDAIMDLLLPYQEDGLGLRLFGIGKRSPGQQARYDRRQERKQLKLDKKRAKVELKQAQARGEVPTGFEAIGGAISGIFGGGAEPEMFPAAPVQGGMPTATPRGGRVPRGQRGVSVEINGERKWYENPAVIVGGLVVLGTGVYLLTRKKK